MKTGVLPVFTTVVIGNIEGCKKNDGRTGYYTIAVVNEINTMVIRMMADITTVVNRENT